MDRGLLRRACPVFLFTVASVSTDLNADVLYSNLQGNYLSQQTASYAYANTTSYMPNGTAPGDTSGVTGPGFGTYYNTGYDSVNITSLSFYGGTSELSQNSPSNPTGTLGDNLTIAFFDLAGNEYYQAGYSETSQFQGVGLHTATYDSDYTYTIPGAGYVVFQPSLLQETDVKTGEQTQWAPGPATFTGYFGAAPTVGEADPTYSAIGSFNYKSQSEAVSYSSPAVVSSPAYLQIEIDGTGVGQSGTADTPNPSPIWNPTGSGTWDNASNWTSGTPNSTGASANFVGSIHSNSTVTLVSGETVGVIDFDNPLSYTLTGSGVLTLSNTNFFSGNTVPSQINVWAGGHTITDPVVVSSGLNVNTVYADPSSSTPDLTLPLAFTMTGALNKSGVGTLLFSASTSGITPLNLPAINVSAGTLTLQSSTAHVNRILLTSASLTIASGATLNLGNNDLDLSSGSLSTINSLVATGLSNGTWTGSGITSSAAASDSSHLTAVGVIQNNQGGAPLFTAANPFDGVTPGASDILAKYTYYGDANLDGKVDGSDYSRIDFAYAANKSYLALNPGGTNLPATGWFNGDFNYDGVVDGSDYTLIDNAFNTQGTILSAILASPDAQVTAQIAGQIAGPGGVSAVPEPAMGLLSLITIGLVGRRRRM